VARRGFWPKIGRDSVTARRQMWRDADSGPKWDVAAVWLQDKCGVTRIPAKNGQNVARQVEIR